MKDLKLSICHQSHGHHDWWVVRDLGQTSSSFVLGPDTSSHSWKPPIPNNYPLGKPTPMESLNDHYARHLGGEQDQMEKGEKNTDTWHPMKRFLPLVSRTRRTMRARQSSAVRTCSKFPRRHVLWRERGRREEVLAHIFLLISESPEESSTCGVTKHSSVGEGGL